MIVWGGANDSGVLGDGGRYDPVTDTWKPIRGFPATHVEIKAIIDDNGNGKVDLGETEATGLAVQGLTESGESLGNTSTRAGETTFDGFGGATLR